MTTQTNQLLSTLLTKAQILAASDRQHVDVQVPEWGGTVRVRSMSGAERDKFEETIYVGEGEHRRQDLRNLRAKLVAATLIDADGNQLFTEDDVAALGQKSSAALTRCFEAAQRLNGMTKSAVEEAKNASGGDQNAASTSA